MEEVYVFVDTMPQLQVIDGNFGKYILDTLSQFKEEFSQFTFQIEMVINTEGRPCNVKINNKKDKNLNKMEVMIKKKIENMPCWSPGIRNGIPVNTLIRRKIYINVR